MLQDKRSTYTLSLVFFFNDHTTPLIYTLSLHDALPISLGDRRPGVGPEALDGGDLRGAAALRSDARARQRSEEHTSELQSHSEVVCRLLLEKKKCARSEARL